MTLPLRPPSRRGEAMPQSSTTGYVVLCVAFVTLLYGGLMRPVDVLVLFMLMVFGLVYWLHMRIESLEGPAEE